MGWSSTQVCWLRLQCPRLHDDIWNFCPAIRARSISGGRVKYPCSPLPPDNSWLHCTFAAVVVSHLLAVWRIWARAIPPPCS